jgi:hypothetical protein
VPLRRMPAHAHMCLNLARTVHSQIIAAFKKYDSNKDIVISEDEWVKIINATIVSPAIAAMSPMSSGPVRSRTSRTWYCCNIIYACIATNAFLSKVRRSASQRIHVALSACLCCCTFAHAAGEP